MINPVPDFDAEKRRRWYAASIGAVGSSTLIAILSFSLFRQGFLENPPGPIWELALVVFGFWLLFFVAKYVAAYALWYRPYASRIRAIGLSLCATFVVYLALIGGALLFTVLKGNNFDFAGAFRTFWQLHLMTYGLPYFAAVPLGWCFARPAPDVRESF